jgi:type I restriction enzyme S subunit
LPEGTFVIAIYGLEAEGVRSTGSIITKQSTISQACMAFTPKGNISNEFLYSWYKKHGNVIGLRYAQGTKQQNLSYDIIEKFKIRYPSLKEQDKLNSFISLLDVRITTQIRIIEDLKSLSDGICERLYTPSDKESWQTYKYADLLSISNERNSKLQYTNVLSASQEYGMIERNELNIDIKFEASSIMNYKIVRPNQYVIHLRSFQGGFAYSEKTGVCSPAYTILVPNEKLSTAFLKYYFTSKKFIDSLRIVTYGIRDGRSISVEEFLQLKVAIPDVARQQHIVHVMQLWEEKIKTEESYLSKLQQQKQYLLSTMFV